ncbi:hypothetical protein E2I00_006626, partial [Balaenoptera physalus]
MVSFVQKGTWLLFALLHPTVILAQQEEYSTSDDLKASNKMYAEFPVPVNPVGGLDVIRLLKEDAPISVSPTRIEMSGNQNHAKYAPLALLMVMDLKDPKEIQVLLVFLGEMVILVFQACQVPLVLLALLESVNHALLVTRVHPAHPVLLVHPVILVPLVLQDTKVPLVNLGKLVL